MPGDRLREGDGAVVGPWASEIEKIRVQGGRHHLGAMQSWEQKSF